MISRFLNIQFSKYWEAYIFTSYKVCHNIASKKKGVYFWFILISKLTFKINNKNPENHTGFN